MKDEQTESDKKLEEHFYEGLRRRGEVVPEGEDDAPLPSGVTHVQPKTSADEPAPPPKRKRFSVA